MGVGHGQHLPRCYSFTQGGTQFLAHTGTQLHAQIHERCYDRQQYVLTPQHYLKLLEKKPGALDNARPFKGQPWGEDFGLMLIRSDAASSTRRVNALSEVMIVIAFPSLDSAIQNNPLIENQVFNDVSTPFA